jgi:hypothetical protein
MIHEWGEKNPENRKAIFGALSIFVHIRES